MKKTFQFSSTAALAVLCSLLRANADQPVEVGPPQTIEHKINPHFAGGTQPPPGATTATSPISYHGGPVLATPNVYVIWYGNWNQSNGSDTPAGQQIVRDFLNAVGGSPYFDINESYSTASLSISGKVNFVKDTSDNYSQGTRLTDGKVTAIVQSAINSSKLPNDSNGIYFVLTSTDVSENSGFCNRYCGWHTRSTISGSDIKYAFVGNANRCLSGCAIQSVASPNGNPGVDGMVSVIAHELEEATTDPDLNAWYDKSGAEDADKCAWTFGAAQYQLTNGSWANMHLGTRDFMIQRELFHSTSGDYCAVSVTYDSTGAHLTQ